MRALPLLLLAAGCASTRADGLAGRYRDPHCPYGARVEALEQLRASPPEERERLFPSVADTLRAESARADGFYLSDLEERAVAAAFAWRAEARDPGIATSLELHLDRATVRRKRLADRVLAAAALGLGRFPERESGREVLWAALLDPAERPAIRAASMKALQAHHPDDLEDRLRKAPAAEDPWLRDLQNSLR